MSIWLRHARARARQVVRRFPLGCEFLQLLIDPRQCRLARGGLGLDLTHMLVRTGALFRVGYDLFLGTQ
jgi:hypothetical protein